MQEMNQTKYQQSTANMVLLFSRKSSGRYFRGFFKIQLHSVSCPRDKSSPPMIQCKETISLPEISKR